ncbi:MAG: GAF domain-containing sensor histidine kinase [Anaerolineae bacterium]|nr:GAF domain-containing sensor histidine kinase [Anaerolineae bacterium]
MFNIGLVVNRTLVYGTLTAIIVGLYIWLVTGLGLLFELETGNLTISLLITVLIAVAFQPLRYSVQRAIDRLMYGDRSDPYTVLARLGERLEAALAPEEVLPTIVETVAQALKLPYAAITLNQDDEVVVAAAYGSAQGDLAVLPLVYQSETIGNLQLAPRAPGESFTPADWRLLQSLAYQAGVAAHGVQLTLDLQNSRERIITAREEERRRLQRDLHDGLGPTLASMTLKLDAACNLLGSESPAVEALLRDVKSQMQTTITEVRRLVYELRPPILEQLGLIDALHTLANNFHNGLEVSLKTPPNIPDLPAAIEVAVYRITQEALTNVIAHAHARHCTITLQIDTDVHLEIHDDGCGLPSYPCHGLGLNSMQNRAAQLGGKCRIDSVPGRGVCLHVQLPLRTAAFT